jgi:phosphodiesterase/alkaline phosphatase D-like protein
MGDSTNLSRRKFLAMAAALGATPVWAEAVVHPSRIDWAEHREYYPEGVASGDPDSHSVILWTRRPYTDNRQSGRLQVEVAEDTDFKRVVVTANAELREMRGQVLLSPSIHSDWRGLQTELGDICSCHHLANSL